MSTAMRNVNGSPEQGSGVLTMGVLDSPRRLVPEIWLSVFDKLEDSDKPAFSRACPEWHDWMKGKGTLFLFEKVAPLLLEILPTRTLLKNREICKTWTEIGKHHVQSHPSLHHLDIEERAVKKYDISGFANRFSAAEDVQTFMDENTPRKPFSRANVKALLEETPTVAMATQRQRRTPSIMSGVRGKFTYTFTKIWNLCSPCSLQPDGIGRSRSSIS